MIFDDLIRVYRLFDKEGEYDWEEVFNLAKSTLNGYLSYVEERALKDLWVRYAKIVLVDSLHKRYRIARIHYLVDEIRNASYVLQHNVIRGWNYNFHWSWYGKAYALSDKFWFKGEVDEKVFPLMMSEPEASPIRVGEVKRVMQKLVTFKGYSIFGVYYLVNGQRVTLFDIKHRFKNCFLELIFNDHYTLISRETFYNKKTIYVFDEPGLYRKFKFGRLNHYPIELKNS